MRSRLTLLAALGAAVLSAGCPGDTLGKVLPHIKLDQSKLDFGTLPVLNTKTLTVKVANQGQATLELKKISIAGPDAAAFSLGKLPTKVAAGSTKPFDVSFTPDAERDYQATLTVVSNDQDFPSIDIPLTGTGKTKACIAVTPDHIDFGIVGEGQTAVESLTISAGCTAPLIVKQVGFSKDTPPEFVPVGSWQSGTLQPGDQIPLSVAFEPKQGQQVTTGKIVIQSTDPDNQTVTVDLTASLNRAPIADCGPDSEIDAAPGDTVNLDGSASNDPDGNTPLTFDWQIDQRPVDSNTDLTGPDTQTPSLLLDVPGDWTVSLGVTDALGVPSVTRCHVTLKSIPADKLYVELVWDNAVTDLDLHFLAPGAKLDSAGDCYWGNPTPDFGVQGDPSDDPVLNRDDLAGFGPEIVTYKNPATATYRVVVDFPKTNGAADPTTKATVRVYELGVVVAELSHTLKAAHTLWNVAAIDWPSGKVSPVDTTQTY